MLALSADQLKEVRSILANYAPQHGVLAFGSRVFNDSHNTPQKIEVKPFADLDLALTGQNIDLADLFLLRDAMSQSQLPFRVDICHWNDLPARWKNGLVTEVLQ